MVDDNDMNLKVVRKLLSETKIHIEKRSTDWFCQISAKPFFSVKKLVVTSGVGGIHIDTASSGAECLKLTQIQHYDAILMDHLMPEMDGVECFHALRQLFCKELFIVFHFGRQGKTVFPI